MKKHRTSSQLKNPLHPGTSCRRHPTVRDLQIPSHRDVIYNKGTTKHTTVFFV